MMGYLVFSLCVYACLCVCVCAQAYVYVWCVDLCVPMHMCVVYASLLLVYNSHKCVLLSRRTRDVPFVRPFFIIFPTHVGLTVAASNTKPQWLITISTFPMDTHAGG